MKYLLLILIAFFGTLNVSAQSPEEQYIGDDTVRVYPLIHRYLYAGVWNRLQLISVVWKDNFRPTVAINKGKMRWDPKEPTIVRICPDKKKKTAYRHLSEWMTQNQDTASKIFDLIDDIQKHPFKGLGKAEPLKYHLKGWWSR
jgi:hypothetical protein